MTAEAKFSEVVEAVREIGLDESDQPVEFDHTLIGRVERALGLDFSKGDWLARQQRDKLSGQISRALTRLSSPTSRTLVKSGEGRGNIRYWAPAAYTAHQAQEAEREAARAALDARKLNVMDRIRRLTDDARFYVTVPERITMDLDTAAALLALAEKAGS
jgi:hypothetical protein